VPGADGDRLCSDGVIHQRPASADKIAAKILQMMAPR